MNILPDVCLGPRSNPLHFWDDLDFDPDLGCEFPVYDPDETAMIAVSQSDCLVNPIYSGFHFLLAHQVPFKHVKDKM